MTAKHYLRQLAKIQRSIEILKDEIDERRTRLESTSAPVLGDRVQTSPGGDRFADTIAILADKDLQRQELIYTYESLRDTIVDQILELDNEIQQKVLYERYVHNRMLKSIATELHYSYDRVCHIHGEALISFTRKHVDIL